jgi:hypothetical protein
MTPGAWFVGRPTRAGRIALLNARTETLNGSQPENLPRMGQLRSPLGWMTMRASRGTRNPQNRPLRGLGAIGHAIGRFQA